MRGLAYCLVLAMLFTSGCWSQRELNELALVVAVGIDRTEEDRVLVTAQIARPGSANQAAGGTSGGAVGGAPVYVASAEGRSIFEAIRNLALFTSRRVMWAHNKIIVIGRKQAQRDAAGVVDFFTRNPELRLRTLIALAEDDARSIVGHYTGMEAQPAESLQKVFRHAELVAEAQEIDMKAFAAAYLDPHATPVLPVLHLAPRLVPSAAPSGADPNQVVLKGLGIFREGRLHTYLDEKESRGVSLARSRVVRVVISLPCEEEPGKYATLEVVDDRVSIQPGIDRDGRLSFRVDLNLGAAISSIACPVNLMDRGVVDRLGDRLSALVKEDIERAVSRARETRTDPIGLGAHIRAKLPGYWAEKSNLWPEGIVKARIQVQVRSSIVGAELSTQPSIQVRRKAR